jgi:hypothetical protein
VSGVALDGRVGDPGDGAQKNYYGEGDHGLGSFRVLELTADVAARVDAVAECHDIERDQRGHEGDERDHALMIGRERGRT